MPPKEERKSSEANEEEEKRSKERKKCFYCEETFKHIANFNRHIKQKHKDIAIRCDNHNCCTFFPTENAKKKHNEEVHEKSRERGNYPCNICHKDFGSACKYRAHVEGVHKEFPFKCSFRGCYDYFKRKPEMHSHFKTKHQKDQELKTHECKTCGKKFKIKIYLENHIKCIHGNERWVCDICEKEFISEFSFNRHNVRAHEFRKCSICEMAVNRGLLKKHEKKKICTTCKNEFLCSGHLQEHKKVCKPKRVKKKCHT